MQVREVALERCESTQLEALARIERLDAGAVLVVHATRQEGGMGREGRSWSNPPDGARALLVSIARRGPLDVRVLDELPRRVVAGTIAAVESLTSTQRAVAWNAPNDLVDARSGRKVGGVLIDARTQTDAVAHVVIGIGINVTGGAFVTPDGRDAATLELATGRLLDVDELRAALVDEVIQLLSP